MSIPHTFDARAFSHGCDGPPPPVMTPTHTFAFPKISNHEVSALCVLVPFCECKDGGGWVGRRSLPPDCVTVLCVMCVPACCSFLLLSYFPKTFYSMRVARGGREVLFPPFFCIICGLR